MNDWFEWNGKRCTEYGIHVSEQPPLTLPAERVTFTDVPGRSGSLTTTEGEYVYEDMVLTAQCFIESGARVPEIAAWLRGSGTVIFANRPEGYYEARIINQIPFEKILRGNPHLAFAVNFRCKPFWYLRDVAPIPLTQSGSPSTARARSPSWWACPSRSWREYRETSRSTRRSWRRTVKRPP